MEVVGEHDLDAVPLPDRDRGQDIEVAIEHARGGGRQLAPAACRDASAAVMSKPPRRAELREAGDRANGERGAEDLDVVAVDLVGQPGLPDLIQAGERLETSRCDRRATRAGETAPPGAVSPHAWTGAADPRTRAPAGITTACRSWL